ncbi:MAG: hypothetical protein ACHQ2Z_03405 [Elusimicrobiota bacterium]
MKKKARRSATAKKTAVSELAVEEVLHLEQISDRYAQAEQAWQRMTAPPDGDDTWNRVEEHLLTRGDQDQDRRWKFFSK